MSRKNREKSANHMQKFQVNITVIFITLIIAITLFLTVMILNQAETVIMKNTSELIAANSRQLELNINNYLENVERTGALLFADENAYKYDATDEGIEEYDQIQYETDIMNRIVDIGLMQNFADFGVVYANDHFVGWISNTTQDLYPEGGIYEGFSACINNEKTKDGWTFGIEGNYDRLYYVKRLNANSILVTSFHLNELDTVFEYPKELEGMALYLVDNNNQILYATDDETVGGYLNKEIADLVGNSGSISVRNAKYIANSNVCTNGWRVVCDISTDSIMKGIKRLRNFTVVIAIFIIVISFGISFALIKRATKPMDEVVSSLEHEATIDKLSGVYNKATFEAETENSIKQAMEGDKLTFVMLDMDNFKQINDNLGHEYGDKVIQRMGKLLKSTFSEKALIGRLGGDEFAVFRIYADMTDEQFKNRLNVRMAYLMDLFAEEFAEEQRKLGVSLSIGIRDTAILDTNYKELYKCADMALYKSKKHGKNQFNFYVEGMQDE